MSGIGDQADKGLGGFNISSQLANIQPQGPLPYSTQDLLRHWAWMIALIKLFAHVFSLPVMVFMRRGFGWRYCDEVHIAASFILWQVIALFTTTIGAVAQVGSPWVGVWAWLFLPMAFYRRWRAKQATIELASYSYYPGTPLLAPVVLGTSGRLFRWLHQTLELDRSPFTLPAFLTHPEREVNAGVAESFVRRFIEPAVVITIAIACGVLGLGYGFTAFLVWTAILLHVDETLAQRAGWETFVDMVDAQVVALEKQHILSGGHQTGTQGFSVASVANVGGIAGSIAARMRADGTFPGSGSGHGGTTPPQAPGSLPATAPPGPPPAHSAPRPNGAPSAEALAPSSKSQVTAR